MNRLEDLFASIGAIAKIFVFLTMIALMVPVALVWKRVSPQNSFIVPRTFHSLVLRLLGIRLRITGTISSASPLLFVANHASYLDVIALGSILSAPFIAKSEVAAWPLFGFLAKLQDTVFIERRQARAADQRVLLQNHFAQRQNMILFPEGTSSDGLAVLPFKSSLFSIAEENSLSAPVTVQPVSITCVELDGYPLLREERALYAWYGDMTLTPHLWNVFKRGHFTLDITFHAPILPGECANRKILAAACQERVARGIELALTGRALKKDSPLLPPKAPQTEAQ
jgi:1-acyl-sn-glycerol-3-phosphate acyltransferase